VSDMTFRQWAESHQLGDLPDVVYRYTEAAWQAAQAAQKECVTELLDYAQHDSWRCGYNGECHCGLNAITKKYGLPAVPLPEKGENNEP
jgi:hypothetical protein